MHALARVRDVRSDRLLLACESVAASCGACAGGRGCALRWLARPGGSTLEVDATALGGSQLRPGDAIELEVDDGELLRAALFAYLPPLVGLLGGPMVAAGVAPGHELAALGAAGGGLAAGWVVARWWLRRSPPRYRLRLPGAA